MNSISRLLLSVLAAMALSGPANSQTQPSITALKRPAGEAAMSQPPLLSPDKRAAITRDLIAKWQSAAAKRPGGDGPRWARILSQSVATADAANVLRATIARSVEELHTALIGAMAEGVQPQSSSRTIGNGAVAPQVLGSYVNDLTYTPLPNGRCRVADSRVINSPLVGARNISIEVMANYTSQGGNGTYSNGTGSINCGIATFTTAYALSVSLISPTASGYFKVFKAGLPYQTGNSISMNAGSPYASADIIVSSCQGCAAEIGIQSSASVHYVIDVIGYYLPPVATAFDCVYAPPSEIDVAPNDDFDAVVNSCPAGYSSVSTECLSTSFDVTFSAQGFGFCSGRNRSGSTVAVGAYQRCCRVPGR